MENIVTIFGSCFRKVSCFVCSLLQSIVPIGLFDRTMTEFEVKLLILVGHWNRKTRAYRSIDTFIGATETFLLTECDFYNKHTQ